MKLAYMEVAIKILSFCDKNTTDDPELLTGKYTGNKETKKAKREEAANRKAIGLLRWEQHLRKVLGKSSSIKVNVLWNKLLNKQIYFRAKPQMQEMRRESSSVLTMNQNYSKYCQIVSRLLPIWKVSGCLGSFCLWCKKGFQVQGILSNIKKMSSNGISINRCLWALCPPRTSCINILNERWKLLKIIIFLGHVSCSIVFWWS